MEAPSAPYLFGLPRSDATVPAIPAKAQVRLATPLACVLPLQASLVMTMSLHHTILHSILSPHQQVITMTTPRAQEAKRETLNLRIKHEERCLIDRAAQLLGKNRTDFMLDATRRAALEAILDQTILQRCRSAG